MCQWPLLTLLPLVSSVFCCHTSYSGFHPSDSTTFLSTVNVDNLLPTQEMLVQSLGQEDPLEKEMAAHFHIIA